MHKAAKTRRKGAKNKIGENRAQKNAGREQSQNVPQRQGRIGVKPVGLLVGAGVVDVGAAVCTVGIAVGAGTGETVAAPFARYEIDGR